MTTPPTKTSVPTHLLCGWPLLLVFIGGALGGLLGGGAYGLNLLIAKSSLHKGARIALILATGIASVLLWLLGAILLHAAFMEPSN